MRRSAFAVVVVFLLGGGPAPGAAAAATCGDGVLDPGEACDDANLQDGDCCSSQCALVACSAAPQPLVAWRELGPTDRGGRVSALAADPSDPLRLFAGTPGGGLWRSADGGSSWLAVAPWLAALPLSVVAVAPDDPQVLLLGTGSLSEAGSTSGAVGVLRSGDGGQTFAVAPGTEDAPYVAQLLFWPGEPSRVLAATDLGLRLSTDGGASFAEVLRGDAIAALARDPFDADAALAAGRIGLYRSEDRGQSWSRLASWPLQSGDIYGTGTQALAVSGATPDRVWAAVQVRADFNATDRGLLLRSDDGGRTFTELATAPPFCPGPRSCGFALALAVDPLDDDRLLLGGDQLYASDDGGAGWWSLGSGHPGVHALRMRADGGAWMAGDLGVAQLDPSWTFATPRNDGLAVASAVSLAVTDESPPRVLLGSEHAGTLLGFGDPPGWQVVFGDHAPAGAVCFDPFDPARMFASLRGGDFHRSDDGGASFAPASSGLDFAESAADVAPLVASPLLPDVFYTGRLSLFRTQDAGDAWSAFRPPGSPHIAVAAASRVAPDRVFFALAEGATLYRTDWIFTNAFLLDPEPDQRIVAIWLDRDDERRIYVAVNATARQRGRVFKTHDAGVTWTEVTPPQMDLATGLVKDAYGALYVSTVSGVLRSPNDGATWAAFEEALPPTGVSALATGGGRLFAGTEGRGVFDVPLQELTVVDSIPPGRRFLLDGQLHEGPVYLRWTPGSTHTVEPYLLQTADTRQSFVSWSDGGALAHDVVASGGNAWLTAAIRESYRLSPSVTPADGGTLTLDPPSPDGFYDAGTFVTAIAAPAPDHRFVGFQGAPSSSDGVLGYAAMDRPRALEAVFAPLRTTLRTEPPGLELEVDGATVTTPVTFQWEAGSSHALAAPDRVDPDPADPAELAFDRWSDLLPRSHDFVMRRDTFLTDLTARYVTVLPRASVPAGGARVLRGVGADDAPRAMALRVEPGAGTAPQVLQIARSRIEGVDVQEVALAPTAPATERVAWVEGDGTHALRTELVLHNPGSALASVDLHLRDAAGSLSAATGAPLTVGAGVRETFDLVGTLVAGPYAGMLRVTSDLPLVVHVQRVRENVRLLEFVDTLRTPSFGPADRGVPAAPEVMALLRSAGTRQRLVLLNPGSTPLSGAVAFHDEGGAPLPVDAGDGAAAVHPYDLPTYGHLVLDLALPSVGGGGSVLETVQARLLPASGQAPPQVELQEEETVGDVGHGPLVLPRTRPPSAALDAFRVPLAQDLRDAGVVAANLGSATVPLTLRALDPEGVAIDEVVVDLPPGTQRPLLAGEVLPALPADFRGVLEGRAPAPLHVVGVGRAVNGRAEALHVGFPAPSGTPGGPAFLSWAVDGDSWTTALWLLHPGASTLDVDLVTTGRDGAPLPWPVTGSLLP